MLGLLLEDVSNPFDSAVHRAVEREASQRGVAVLASSIVEDPARERELALALINRRVDGLIIAPASSDHSYLHIERRAGAAMVFIDRPPHLFDCDWVTADNAGGSRAGTAHLLAQGHRRIAFLGDLLQISTARSRAEGFAEAMREAGARIDPRLVVHNIQSIEAARSAAQTLLRLDDRPTAIFTAQNLITIGVIAALRAAGLQHEVAVVGYDDFLLADLLSPAITVVAQDPAEMGRMAATLLFERLDGSAADYRHVVLPTRLIPRGSGEITPGR
jgi:LacI family transcriptional regulator